MDLEDAGLRARLREQGPVGRWVTVGGSHQALGVDVVEFHPDGTGEVTLARSVLGESHEQFGFHWTVAEPGVLSCLFVPEELVRSDGEEQDPDRQRVAFEFARRATDVGTFWVMQESGRDGFWMLLDPVMPG